MGCFGYIYACASGAAEAGFEQQAVIYMLVALGFLFALLF